MTSEAGFRARLAIPGQVALFDYWRACAGDRAMPSREDLDPAAMRGLLPSLCLIECGADFHGATVRLAGSELRDIYGFELTGKRLGEVSWGGCDGYWRSVYRGIVAGRAPLQGAVRGPAAEREHVTLLWLRLPLSDDGTRVDMILCYDSVAPLDGRVQRGRRWATSTSGALCADVAPA